MDIEGGTVALENGTVLNGDLIIAADGERSMIKAAYGGSAHLMRTPFKVLRAIILTKALEEDPATKSLLEWRRKKWTVFVGKDDFHTIAWFEGKNGELQDLESGYPDPNPQLGIESDPVKAREKLLEKFGDFHPDIIKVLRKTTLATDWDIWFTKSLPYLPKGRSILVGDTAQNMFPTTGQGGSQGIEDAACLEIILSDLPSKSELAYRLELYSSIQKSRTALVRWLSPLRPGQEEELLVKDPKHPIHKTHIRTRKEHSQFLYDYDIMEETRKAVHEDEQFTAVL